MPSETRAVDLKELERLKGTMSTKAYMSPIKDYVQPKLGNVVTKIQAADPSFVPDLTPCPEVVLKAFIPLMVSETQSQSLTFRSSVVIDCGFSLELPASYRVRVNYLPELLMRGGYSAACEQHTSGMFRMKVWLHNLGREILVIKHGDPIAIMTVEPTYFFDWVDIDG
jgi:hypothetical protein